MPAAPSLSTASPWREMERVAVSSRRARTSSGMSSGSRRRRVTSPPPPPPWPPPPPGLVDAEYMNTDPYPCNDCNGSLTPPTSPTGPWKKITGSCWESDFSNTCASRERMSRFDPDTRGSIQIEKKILREWRVSIYFFSFSFSFFLRLYSDLIFCRIYFYILNSIEVGRFNRAIR